VFDLSQFRDPIGQASLRYSTGLDIAVQEFILMDPKAIGVIQIARMLVHDTLVVGAEKYIAMGFKDFHGKLISSAMAEVVAKALEEDLFVVGVTHHCY
jgi:RNase adaptor protein for sRNA GlmZ degradation